MLNSGQSENSAHHRIGRVLFSHRLGVHRLGGSETIPLGEAHYSHDLVGRRIRQGLAHLGIETHELIRPEMFSAPVAFASIKDFRRGDIHIIFKPIEEIRILRGARNIACVVWEFDQLNTHSTSNRPFSNHVRMLKLVDEVWCYCKFTRDVLRKYIDNVHLLPVPFDIPGDPEQSDEAKSELPLDLDLIPAMRLSSGTSGTLGNLLRSVSPSRFLALSIFNPHDLRKNAGYMIRSFALFQRDKPGAVLILKLSVDNKQFRLQNVRSILDRYCSTAEAGDNIFVVTQELPPKILTSLYRIAEFYICASHCEGLGMTVIEAMAHGAIPISVNETAMADYITENNAYVIPSSPEPALLQSNSALNPNLTWHTADITSISLALEEAYRSSPQIRQSKRRAAIEMIRSQYSMEQTVSQLRARLLASHFQANTQDKREVT